MATTKHIILIFALVLFSTQAAISEETQISNTREASCSLQITIYRDTVVVNLESLIQSSGVKNKAIKEVLDSASSDQVKVSILSLSSANEEKKVNVACGLKVELGQDVKPAANEFLKALLRNLEKSLTDAFQEKDFLFNSQYDDAFKNYKKAESEFNKLFFEEPSIIVIYSEDNLNNNATNKQLETTVDLSKLSQDMSLAEVLEILSKSVDPPLQIQPNWRNLADLPAILPTTPAEIGPLPKVKLRTAIETLLAGLSTSDVPIGYLYHDGVITIATKDSIKVPMVTFVFDISGLLVNGRTSNSLIKAIKETIEPESWYDENIQTNTTVPSTGFSGGGYGSTAYGITPPRIKNGEGKIVDMQGGKISVRNTPEVQNKIMNFLTSFPKEIPSEPVESIPTKILFEEQQAISSKKRVLEMDIARLKASQTVIEELILKTSDQTGSKVKHDSITTELERLIERQIQQLDLLIKEHQAQVARGLVSPKTPNETIEAEEKLARTKIELAKRREELGKEAGSEQLANYNQQLSSILLDLAMKKAEFQVIEKQLSEIDSQIRAASTTDPKVQKYRQARKAFEEAEKRLDELKDMKSNMQPPQVIAIGLE